MRSGQPPQTPTTPLQHSLWFVLIVALFITCLLTANITAVKLVQVFGLIVPAGIVIFPLSHIIGDVLTEVYGYRQARRVIWLGFVCNLIAVMAIWLGVLGLMDTPREAAKNVISRLRELGIRRMIMLSGDNQQVADAVAKEVGIDEALGDLMPDAKVEAIRKLSTETQSVPIRSLRILLSANFQLRCQQPG
jgi:hypothetical protein